MRRPPGAARRRRSMRRTFGARVAVGLALGSIVSPPGRCAGLDDLDAAFLAAFGQPAPFVRSVSGPIRTTAMPSKIPGDAPFVFVVRPDRLVALGRGLYALVAFETDERRAHAVSGEIAVAYLRRSASRWERVGVWPELLASGVGGEPANAGAELDRFGGDPLFVARSEWVGMGISTDWFDVVRLARDRPVAYDDVLGGAVSPTPGSPIMVYPGDTCRNDAFTARIEPPRAPGALFSVRYHGWTSPPDALSPKRPLHLVTDDVPHGHRLVMRPQVPVPTCGR